MLGHLDSERILNGITTSGTIYGTYKGVTINNNTISNSEGSSCEITIAASNGHYTMYLKNVGYLGWSSGNTLKSDSSVSSNNFRWDFSYASGTLTITNAQSTGRQLQYNSGSPRFACYDGGGQQAPSLFKRSGTSTPQITVTTGNASNVSQTSATLNGSFSGVTTGLSVTEIGFYFGTSNNPTEKFTVSGTSTPFTLNVTNLDEGTTYSYKAYAIESYNGTTTYRYGEVRQFTTFSSGGGSPTGSQQGWYELPKMNIQKSGDYYINSTSSSEYYAWHMCTGGETGPGGKTARNYTVCYSSTHHCPVWVAAPRHSMYVGGSGRNDSYRKDSLIPSTIQYSSTSTGGGCNKGHMLGSAERTSSVSTNKDVFYYPNIAPQLSSGFNTGGGGWNLLEEFVDGQVCSDTLYVVIGCYFDAFSHTYKKNNSTVTISQSPSTISFGGRSDVHMPTMFYYVLLRTKKGNSGKALKDCNASEMKCAAFVRTHSNELKGVEITSYDMMTVSDLEALTGVEYFTNVSNAPKSTATASDWGL